jgi:hypothetical protein
MYNNATFIDKEQLKNLKKMDNFVKDNMVRFGEDVSEKLRELITKIIEKGHYYEAEADVLNMIGNEYNQWKKQKGSITLIQVSHIQFLLKKNLYG